MRGDNVSRLLHANFARMFVSAEFTICALVSLAFGTFNMLSSCVINSPSYKPTFERDLFTVSGAEVVIAAAFIGLFFGTENSVVRNRLMVGHTRGGVYWANFVTAVIGAFIINALSMLPYAVAAPFRGATLGELTADELALRVLTEITAVTAVGCVCFLASVVFSKKSLCAAGSLLAAIIMTYLPEAGGAALMSPCGQLQTLRRCGVIGSEHPAVSLAVAAAAAAIGADVFRRKDLK